MHHSHFTLPLQNPILIFLIILIIILFSPLIFNRLRIPNLAGMIIAGALIGPNGLGLMLRDSSIILYGTVGLLYIMFLAGLEIDAHNLKKNFKASMIFGFFTFAVPVCMGFSAMYYILGNGLMPSIMMGGIFSAHTLITYPIVSRFGITKNRSVTVAAGGTVITDTFALLILAGVAGLYRGSGDSYQLLKMFGYFMVFGAFVIHGFPVIARWYFKNFDDSIGEYIFALGMVFLGAFLAELAGMEGILGAFFTGLALNRMIPRTSPLMNRIHFVGNSLFIPVFLIGVGMLMDFSVFFKGWGALWTGLVMTVTAVSSKYIAAAITAKINHFTKEELSVLFGLSNSHVAATLAAVLIGHEIITGYDESGNPVRLLSDDILNASILMIFATSTISAFITQKGAKAIAILGSENGDQPGENEKAPVERRILIPLSNPKSIKELTGLSYLVSPDHSTQLFGLSVIDHSSQDPAAEDKARKNLEAAEVSASGASRTIHSVMRYDLNIVHGISNAIREYRISDLILGLHGGKGISDSFLGYLTEGVLNRNNVNTLIYKSVQPMATVTKLNVILPQGAEKEIGFSESAGSVIQIAKNAGKTIQVWSVSRCFQRFQDLARREQTETSWSEFTDWEQLPELKSVIQKDEALIFFMSREGQLSWNSSMKRIPQLINSNFSSNNIIFVFPKQYGVAEIRGSYLKADGGLLKVEDGAEQLTNLRRRIFRVKRNKTE